MEVGLAIYFISFTKESKISSDYSVGSENIFNELRYPFTVLKTCQKSGGSGACL